MSEFKLIRYPTSGIITCLLPICVFLLAACWAVTANAQDATTTGSASYEDVSHEDVATTLQRLVAAADDAERATAFDRLRQMDSTDRSALIRGLVYFARNAKGTKESMACGAVLERLEVPDESVIRAVIPLLDTEDDLLRAEVRNILGGFENQSAERPPDYSAYRAIIADAARENAPLPLGLIAYMYEKSPGTALLTTMRGFGVHKPERIKQLRWAEHTIADVVWKQQYGFIKSNVIEPAAAEQLAATAQDEAWWVRLYAAEIMRRHSAFGVEELVGRLQRDENQLVRDSAARIGETATPAD